MKLILLTGSFTTLFAMLFWLNGGGIASARTIDISQPPYNANTTNADNGPIFNQAINDLRAQQGGTIYIPAGNWKFSTAITISEVSGQLGALIIRGDGAHPAGGSGGTDLVYTGTSTSVDAFTVAGTGASNLPTVQIRDLALDGTQSPSNRNGFVFNYGLEFYLSGVTVTGFNGTGIVINNTYYSSIRDADIAYCGIGVDCTSGNADQLRNVHVHYCKTAGLYNPQRLIGCAIESNYADGIVIDNAAANVSIHDCYFTNNNLSNTQEGADIYGNATRSGHASINVSLSGNCTFVGDDTRTYPYRRMRGALLVTRTGAQFTPATYWAELDLLNYSWFVDNSGEQHATNLSWTSASAAQITFQWHYTTPARTSLTVLY